MLKTLHEQSALEELQDKLPKKNPTAANAHFFVNTSKFESCQLQPQSTTVRKLETDMHESTLKKHFDQVERLEKQAAVLEV